MNGNMLIRNANRRFIPSIYDEFFGDLDRMFGLTEKAQTSRLWIPAADVYETEKDYRIDIEVSGVKKEDVQLEVKDNILTARGKREYVDEKKEKSYHCCERYYGEFQRSWKLPESAAPDKIEAECADGLLKIIIPKKPEEQPKKIDIKVQ